MLSATIEISICFSPLIKIFVINFISFIRLVDNYKLLATMLIHASDGYDGRRFSISRF